MSRITQEKDCINTVDERKEKEKLYLIVNGEFNKVIHSRKKKEEIYNEYFEYVPNVEIRLCLKTKYAQKIVEATECYFGSLFEAIDGRKSSWLKCEPGEDIVEFVIDNLYTLVEIFDATQGSIHVHEISEGLYSLRFVCLTDETAILPKEEKYKEIFAISTRKIASIKITLQSLLAKYIEEEKYRIDHEMLLNTILILVELLDMNQEKTWADTKNTEFDELRLTDLNMSKYSLKSEVKLFDGWKNGVHYSSGLVMNDGWYQGQSYTPYNTLSTFIDLMGIISRNTIFHIPNDDGILSSELYPSILEFIDNKISLQVWVKNGKLHSMEWPAFLLREKNKEIVAWFHDGLLHREKHPAYTYKRYTRGCVKDYECQKWYVNGILHREDGPAICKCYVNEGFYFYFRNGRMFGKRPIEYIRCEKKYSLDPNTFERYSYRTLRLLLMAFEIDTDYANLKDIDKKELVKIIYYHCVKFGFKGTRKDIK